MRLLFFITTIVGIHLSTAAVSQCEKSYFNYKDFVDRQAKYNRGRILMRDGYYTEAISHYKLFLDDPNLRLPGRLEIAACYYLLHQPREAMTEIDKAILGGHPIEAIRSQEELEPIFPEIEKHYNKLRPKYLAKINLDLRVELVEMIYNDQGIRYELRKPENYTKRKRDSIYSVMKIIDSVNLTKLRKIISAIGWPTPKIIGSNETINDVQREVHLDLFAIHNSEEVNISLLQLAKEEACNGNENWFTVIPMMKNLLWRYSHDGFNKLRYTYLTDNGMIDWEKSYFQLKILSELMHDNPSYRISLFVVRDKNEGSESVDKYRKTLDEIRNFLISEKINSELIFIENEIRTVEDDGKGKYRIAYKLY